jgi:hypothetical protein
VGITVAKRTKPVRVVWVNDPDVTPNDDKLLGWIPVGDATCAEGADVFEVRPLDSPQRLRLGGTAAGDRVFFVVSDGVLSVNGETSVMEGKTRTPVAQYLRRVDPAALADLCAFILAISDGEDPQSWYTAHTSASAEEDGDQGND